MENSKYQILPIFSRPLLAATLPSHLSGISSFLDKQKMREEMDGDYPNEYGIRSESSYILNLPECKLISEYILSLAKDFGTQVLNHDCEGYKFSQSWISIKKPNQYHRTHQHPNSLISGVFYYGTFLDDTPAIGFKPDEFPKNLQPSYKNDQNPFLLEELFTAKSGYLYMFPSHYLHFVPENRTNIDRKSVAFNIIPTKGFGIETNLTELKV